MLPRIGERSSVESDFGTQPRRTAHHSPAKACRTIVSSEATVQPYTDFRVVAGNLDVCAPQLDIETVRERAVELVDAQKGNQVEICVCAFGC
ncbi:MAG: hypothetical protein LBD27_03430 [Tannerella sp.]|jgi:hypothetical protein|nr:hypothetical protein [Tannerella sp.]